MHANNFEGKTLAGQIKRCRAVADDHSSPFFQEDLLNMSVMDRPPRSH